MEEALEMDGLALVRKIRGRNPTLGKMKEWARKNWTGLQGEGPVINSLAKGMVRLPVQMQRGCRPHTQQSLDIWENPISAKAVDPLVRCENRVTGYNTSLGSLARITMGIMESNFPEGHRQGPGYLYRGRSLLPANKEKNGGKNYCVLEYSNESRGSHQLDLGSQHKETIVGF